MSQQAKASLHPVGMPRDARAIMKFKGELAEAIDARLRDASADGRWATPQDVKMDPRDPESLAYWLYKSINPIVRGMKRQGLDVEGHLQPFRRTRFDLLPEGFQAESEVTLSASGDLMCTPGLDGARDRLYLDVAELIFGADIAYANLESTLTTKQVGPTEFTADSTPKINLTPEQYETLVSHKGRRYDVLHLANNHILDCGEEGILTTLARLEADGIAQVGVNASAEEAARPRLTELHGLRIGWVAHTFSVNFKPFPEDKPWIVNMTPFHLEPDPDVTRIERQVRACREAGCDLVFVALHWGMEFELFPHPDQARWAHRFAEAGADAVIGHHPHVPQPVEIYRPASDPTRAVPILYSLGNLSTLLSHPAMVLSLVARMRLATGRFQGRRVTRVAALKLVPVTLVAETRDGQEVIRLVPLLDLLGQAQDPDMRSYVGDVASYAEVVLGEGWQRDAAA